MTPKKKKNKFDCLAAGACATRTTRANTPCFPPIALEGMGCMLIVLLLDRVNLSVFKLVLTKVYSSQFSLHDGFYIISAFPAARLCVHYN